ncbi:hypothetical protein [Pseudodesulfovibrio sp.]|uniref:hypothetical protein n=1 Tax=unclassified Pseudodesulfovibrio TaxID=2661612 RepID=UPI003B00FD80
MSQYETADLSSLDTGQRPTGITMGIDSTHFEKCPKPRPELNGLRLTLPNSAGIYLIDQGLRRWIPNPSTYNNLFKDWNNIITNIDVLQIPAGPDITNGAILATPLAGGPVYLIDNGCKRGISSVDTFNKYYFSWDSVYHVPLILLDYLQSGPDI